MNMTNMPRTLFFSLDEPVTERDTESEQDFASEAQAIPLEVIFNKSESPVTEEEMESIVRKHRGALRSTNSFKCDFKKTSHLPFKALGKILEHTPFAKSVTIKCVALDCEEQGSNGLAAFCKALSEHEALEELSLSYKRHTRGSLVLSSVTDALKNVTTLKRLRFFAEPYALAKLRHQDELQLEATTSMPAAALSDPSSRMVSVAQLCRLPKLTSLKLGGLVIPHEEIEEIEKALSDSNSVVLTELSLWKCYLNDRNVMSLAKMLSRNNTLQKLDLSFNRFGSKGTIALAEALKSSNKTLRSLYLHQISPIGESGNKALHSMLQENFTLQHLWMKRDGSQECEEIQLLLAINRGGKREVIRQKEVRADEWIDALQAHRKDLSEIYYFFSKNPMLCGSCTSG